LREAHVVEPKVYHDMTSTVNNLNIQFTGSPSYDETAFIINVIVIGLLVVLLVQKELHRSIGTERFRPWAKSLNVAIGPLFLAFALIVARRLVDLIY
jgi:hypothetical protein